MALKELRKEEKCFLSNDKVSSMKKERCKMKGKSMLTNVQKMKENKSFAFAPSKHKGETSSSRCCLPSPFVCVCV